MNVSRILSGFHCQCRSKRICAVSRTLCRCRIGRAGQLAYWRVKLREFLKAMKNPPDRVIIDDPKGYELRKRCREHKRALQANQVATIGIFNDLAPSGLNGPAWPHVRYSRRPVNDAVGGVSYNESGGEVLMTNVKICRISLIILIATIFLVRFDAHADEVACPACAKEIVLSRQGVTCLFEGLDDYIAYALDAGIALVDLKMCQSRPLLPGAKDDGGDKSTDPQIVNPSMPPPINSSSGISEPTGDAPSFFLLAHWQLTCIREHESEIRANNSAPVVFSFDRC